MEDCMSQNIDIKKFNSQIHFPTLIFSATAGDATDRLNTTLLELVYAERARDMAGIQRSNFAGLGGWHSQNFLHRESAYSPLVKMIDEMGRQISTKLGYAPSHELRIGTMWSIINPPGASNRAHIHPDCLWSGVYYVKAPPDCGVIEFIDPRTQSLMHKGVFDTDKKRPRECWTSVKYAPVAGKMLIFPAWLYHAVMPNMSTADSADADRVIISFNLSQRRRR